MIRVGSDPVNPLTLSHLFYRIRNMDRRTFLRSTLALGLSAGCLTKGLWSQLSPAEERASPASAPFPRQDEDIKDYLNRMRHFDEHFSSDTVVSPEEQPLLASCVKKLRQVEGIVGYSQFTVISFPMTLAVARNYGRVEAFTADEVDFLQRVFYTDASRYGFMDHKAIDRLEHEIDPRSIWRVPGTPHFLYQGKAVETFETLRNELGQELILTSGVRGNVKQMLLFLGKANQNRGNLSLSSRQLAPPGYSFHGVGDLDVGKAGFGAENFTERFMLTDVYRKLADRGYLALRYPQGNFLGVRFEPWHIKVVTSA